MIATATAVRVRRAATSSVCAAPGCTVIIRAGDLIGRLPGKGWAHLSCPGGLPDRAASSPVGLA
jgi:hypothetical protein